MAHAQSLSSLLVIDEDDHGRPQRLFYGASSISEPSCDTRFQFATMRRTIGNLPLQFSLHHSKVDHLKLAHSFHPQLANLTCTLPHKPSAASSTAASDADTVASVPSTSASPVSCAADVKDALPSLMLVVAAVLCAGVQCCVWLAARGEGLWESLACMSRRTMRRSKCLSTVALSQAFWCFVWCLCISIAWVVYLPGKFAANVMSLACEILQCWHTLERLCREHEQVPAQRSVCVCRGHHRVSCQ